jgi:hypothetical protein
MGPQDRQGYSTRTCTAGATNVSAGDLIISVDNVGLETRLDPGGVLSLDHLVQRRHVTPPIVQGTGVISLSKRPQGSDGGAQRCGKWSE